MPTSIHVYACDRCGREFDSYSEAEECERIHEEDAA